MEAGVSYEQLKKLKQGQTRTTNVEDAIKVANYFDLTIEQFISGVEASGPDRLVRILDQLSPAALDVLTNAANAQLASETAASGKSDEDAQ